MQSEVLALFLMSPTQILPQSLTSVESVGILKITFILFYKSLCFTFRETLNFIFLKMDSTLKQILKRTLVKVLANF